MISSDDCIFPSSCFSSTIDFPNRLFCDGDGDDAVDDDDCGGDAGDGSFDYTDCVDGNMYSVTVDDVASVVHLRR